VIRRPPEDGVVALGRSRGTLSFPAKFMLVRPMNPCPCIRKYHSDESIDPGNSHHHGTARGKGLRGDDRPKVQRFRISATSRRRSARHEGERERTVVHIMPRRSACRSVPNNAFWWYYWAVTYSDAAPALSAREATVLRWASEGQRARITTEDIQALLGEQVGAKVASSLARKGLLGRVGRGIYTVRPPRAAAPPLVGIAHLLVGHPYYVGGPAVLNLHRLTRHIHPARIDVHVRGHRRARMVGATLVVFHAVGAWAFEFGLTSCVLEGVSVTVSDPERTLLDMLERSSHLVDVRIAQQAVGEALPRVRVDRLVDYASRWPTASTCQRLGLLLERSGVSSDMLAPLEARVAASSGVPAMIPDSRRVGGVHPVWRVVMNDMDSVLSERGAVLRARRR
jgi:predicted transcriptional regulator of viral defense system